MFVSNSVTPLYNNELSNITKNKQPRPTAEWHRCQVVLQPLIWHHALSCTTIHSYKKQQSW